MRAMLVLTTLALGSCTCGRDGDGWAEETFGAEGAAVLLDAATPELQRMGAPGEAAWAPRPFVVFLDVTGVQGEPGQRLRFHRINARLGDLVGSSEPLVQSFVIVHPQVDAEFIGNMRVPGGDTAAFRYEGNLGLIIRHRETGLELFQVVEGQDDAALARALEALPEELTEAP